MKYRLFTAQFPTKSVATSLKKTITPTTALTIDTNDFSISVNSLGTTTYKIKYDDGTHFQHTFHITDCKKYFPLSKYQGLTADDLDEMDEKVIICVFGDYMIECNRNKAPKKFFSNQKKEGKKVYYTEIRLDDRFEFEDSFSSMVDSIADPYAGEPLDIVLRKEFFSIFGEKYKSLTDKQKIVIDGILAGKSQVDIAREEGVDATAIRDRLKGARKILK